MNSRSQTFLDTPIEYLKGVGPQRADLLKKELQVFTFYDLLTQFPFRYVDRTRFYKVNEVSIDYPYVQLRGKIKSMTMAGKPRNQRLIAKFYDESGTIDLLWFAGAKWMLDKLKGEKEFIVFGKATSFKGQINIPHPEIEEVSEENTRLASSLQAVYNSTEKLKSKGLDSRGIYKLMRVLVANIHKNIPETISDELLGEYKLMQRERAFQTIHLPENPEALRKAEYRLKFEELFFIQLRLLRLKVIRQKNFKGFVFGKVGEYFNTFYTQYLPFDLTGAQKRVIKEIRYDMGSGKQMNRLLQGDVGSGKTLVALMTMLIALDNGFQACIIAPTEILAAQHYESISKMLEKLPIKVELLTGSTKKSNRKIVHEQLQTGTLHILIGTHALMEDAVLFKNLGLIVIDEQHRFGVAQRARMWKKNTQPPHVLIMSATPIPRTLAMTLYGDLDVSIIDELPPGRKPISTSHKFDSQRLRVFGFMKEQIAIGRQVYIVYPLIEESEKLDLKNLMDGYESIVRAFAPPDYRVSIVHGQMKAADKNFEMQRFVKGETQIMVATTVIEVGVNVPNASVMVIENAERFGLSQLHQLRGRVGRGADKSYCILMTSFKLSADSKIRINTMVGSNDGFEIAEVDLRLRGPGDLSGTQQSGVLDLKISDLAKDVQIVQLARSCASQILAEDPTLEKPSNQRIAQQYVQLNQNKTNWSRIS